PARPPLHEAPHARGGVRGGGRAAGASPGAKGVVMAFVAINPYYREELARHGLRTPADFLALSGVICCGHPDRHVARLSLGEGPAALGLFLKKEHRVRWKDRLANAWAGFGFVSKAYREYLFLRELAGAGVRCPEPVAAGEDGRGRAFLLVREVGGA